MKVLLANAPFGGGGVTTFAKQVITCLSSDVELFVVLTDDKSEPITNHRVKVLYYDTMKLTVQNALFFIDLINNDIKPDVIIASSALIIPVIAPFLLDSIRVITISHSGRFLYSKYCAVNHQYLDKIIAASSFYNKKYIEKCFNIKDEEKIKVIYNFVSRNEELEQLRFNKSNQSPIVIVYAGATSIHKSPVLVAKIVQQLLNTKLDFRFYWTGSTQIPLVSTRFKKSRLKDIKQILPKDERLIFPGRIPSKQDYDKLLGSANIFLAPSRNEGCSMAFIEAHRAGCIMIVGDYKNSNQEIVKAVNSGFVIDHKDIASFVKVISDIILNHHNYSHIYNISHSAFIEKLSYPVWRDSFLNVINSGENHKQRNRSVSKTSIMKGIIKMKWLKLSTSIERFVCFSLPTYYSFKKMYRNRNKHL